MTFKLKVTVDFLPHSEFILICDLCISIFVFIRWCKRKTPMTIDVCSGCVLYPETPQTCCRTTPLLLSISSYRWDKRNPTIYNDKHIIYKPSKLAKCLRSIVEQMSKRQIAHAASEPDTEKLRPFIFHWTILIKQRAESPPAYTWQCIFITKAQSHSMAVFLVP